jgi:hypothetical protein
MLHRMGTLVGIANMRRRLDWAKESPTMNAILTLS